MAAGDETRNPGWMHVYAQPVQHEEAEIRGTREALKDLRDALDAAIAHGTGEATAFANDGEGYVVRVRRIEVLGLLGPLPYTDEAWPRIRHAGWAAPPPGHAVGDRIAAALREAFAEGVRLAAANPGAPVGHEAYAAAEAAVAAGLDDVREALEPLRARALAPGASSVPDDGRVTVFMSDCRKARDAVDGPS